MTLEEQSQLKALEQKQAAERATEEEAKLERKYAGYLFFCSDGCGFVGHNHRCEQWNTLTFVSPKLQAAMKERFGK